MHTELIASPLALPVSKTPRSEGVHVSKIIRNIARLNGILKADVAESFSLTEVQGDQSVWWAALSETDRLRICIGLAWEQWYIPQIPDVVDHPGEMLVDGIYMTHDGESLDTITTHYPGYETVYANALRVQLACHEVKATYKSINTVGEDLATQWMWLAQLRAYCKGLNTRLAYLHVLFLCGDYRRPIVPKLRVWRIVFTQEEIDDNWDVMLTHMRHQQLLDHEHQMGDTNAASS